MGCSRDIGILVVLNPHAGGGRALRAFERIPEEIKAALGDSRLAVTQSSGELVDQIRSAYDGGFRRILSVGGDGTLHGVVNALMSLPDLDMAVGSLPMGTGSDWARALGIPKDPASAIRWLAEAEATRCDVGQIEWAQTDRGAGPQSRWFLNVASVGISGMVVDRMSQSARRSSLSYLQTTISCLLRYAPVRVRVTCDEDLFYEGSMHLMAAANGQYFGRGMHVAPQALIDDGKLDVLLAEGMGRMEALGAFPTLYRGAHLNLEICHSRQARSLSIQALQGILWLDLDGEPARAEEVKISIHPSALSFILQPFSAPLVRSEPRPRSSSTAEAR